MNSKVIFKFLSFVSMIVLFTGTLVACGMKKEADSKSIDKLKIMFVPSKDPDAIVTTTAPLKKLLKDELKKQGYTVGNIDLSVGTNYEAVGEALAAGSIDLSFGMSGGTFILFEEDADVLLTATRKQVNKRSNEPKEWNDGKPTFLTKEQTKSYRSILIAGPSAKGQELAKKVNAGQKISWEDLDSAKWGVSSSTSSAGYIYPSLWLFNHYRKTVADLKMTTKVDSYTSGLARLASGQIDILPAFEDARRDVEEAWTTTFNRKESIWKETSIVGITPPIYNDAITVSKHSKIMNEDFKKALSLALIHLAKTKEGQKVIQIYTHEGYQTAQSSDYDSERAARKMLKETEKKK